MAYQVIARKWRPQKFAEVVGQEHIVRTLKNELRQGRTAHAYLFVGPRGIGKTTIARIFAKALNCKNLLDGEPCCVCESCKAISDGSSLDVIEIDGASNNSVDNVRNLREEAQYAPVGSKYKIYIIDEVHMLSTGAWNALLKTVEEPPSHVKFLFATTEAHKVLGTIVSRCQRFDLQRISTWQIAKTLEKIAVAEKVKIKSSALNAIARAADGGMRDAQSLLDQIISFFAGEDSEISEEQIIEIFGLTAAEDMEKLVSSMLVNDKISVISLIHKIASQGKNLEKLFEDILAFLRAVEICLIMSDPTKILGEDESRIAVYKQLASTTDIQKTQLLLENISQGGRALHDALNKQVFLETIILKAMRIAHSVKLDDLIARIQELREKGSFSESLKKKSSELIPTLEQKPSDNVIPSISHIEHHHQTDIVTASTSQTTENEPAKAQKDSFQANQKTNSIQSNNWTPENLWHELIQHMDKLNRPILKGYLQEGKPIELAQDKLIVVYDENFEDIHVREIRSNIRVLNQCLHSITGNHRLELFIKLEKGSAAPLETEGNMRSVAEVKQRVANNEFVKTVISMFDGKIVDVRG